MPGINLYNRVEVRSLNRYSFVLSIDELALTWHVIDSKLLLVPKPYVSQLAAPIIWLCVLMSPEAETSFYFAGICTILVTNDDYYQSRRHEQEESYMLCDL